MGCETAAGADVWALMGSDAIGSQLPVLEENRLRKVPPALGEISGSDSLPKVGERRPRRRRSPTRVCRGRARHPRPPVGSAKLNGLDPEAVGRVHVPSPPSHSSNRGIAGLESLLKPIVHYPARSLDLTLPHIGKLMKYGQITSATCARWGVWRLPMTALRLCPCCFAVRERQSISGSLVPTWAVAQPSLRASAPTRSTRSTSNTCPRHICPLPILGGHFRTQMRCQSGPKRTLTNELKASEKQIFVAHSILVA